MYRLIQLMESTEAAKAWTDTRNPLTREGLDARQSGCDEVAASADPYEVLARMYNTGQAEDGTELHFTNIACFYFDGEKTSTMADDLETDEGYLSLDGIFKRVKDIDPNEFNERDGAWINKKAREVRSFLNKYCSPNTGFFK